jgi:Protein of unknown function (DUF3303)
MPPAPRRSKDDEAATRRPRDTPALVPLATPCRCELRFVERCFQLMECDDARLLQQWIVNWHDLMEFEIVLVVPSKDTREIVAARLDEATVKDDP